LYFIFYGNWQTASGATASTAAVPAILQQWGVDIKNSPWLTMMNGGYTASAASAWVSGNSVYMPSSTFGTALTDAMLPQIVAQVLNAGQLPTNPNALYFILTAPEITETSGFCTLYCGYHTNFNFAKNNVGPQQLIKYSFVGNPSSQCLSSCSAQSSTSPNNNPAADAMISVMSHELSETLTDPALNAWWDANGNESADKCAWTYGTYYLDTRTNSYYNVQIGTHRYLIQQNWNIKSSTNQYCALTH